MKPSITRYVGGIPTTIEYDTEAEARAALATIAPTDATFILVSLEMDKEKNLCRGLLDVLRVEFKRQIQLATMTVAEATDIYNRISTTFSALNSGWLRESRMLANNTATGGSFNAARKTFLLNQIDAAIAQL